MVKYSRDILLVPGLADSRCKIISLAGVFQTLGKMGVIGVVIGIGLCSARSFLGHVAAPSVL